MSVMVVIPAYQAKGTIGQVVAEVKAAGFPVIVVDDASTDGTEAAAASAGAEVIKRSVNGGKGAALRDGIAAALGRGTDWVLFMDADGQHLASEIPLFMRAAQRGGADMLVGNRMDKPRGMPLDRWLTNVGMSWIISRVAGQRVPDTQCGFRLASRLLLEKVRLTSDRFEVESELVIRAARAGFRIGSVQISSVYSNERSFIRPLKDTERFFRFLWRIIHERQSRP